jgi:Rrf2 family protein
MIFSRSTQYAIQAMVVLAGHPGRDFVMSRVLAARLNLPESYLSKLMLRFTQAGLLESTRGRAGGYRLRGDPHAITLRQVADVVSAGRMSQECLLGLKTCSDDTACAMHCQWQPVKKRLFDLLDEQNLGRLADGIASGRYRLEELNVHGLTAIVQSARGLDTSQS